MSFVNKFFSAVVMLAFCLPWSSCTKSEYQRLVEREEKRGVRYDSIFLGVNFGMSKKDFYAHCWQLNKEGVLTQGPSNLSVQYFIDSSSLRSPAYLWFYPEFQNDSITKMPIEFSYQSWAPWNQHLSSDSLLLDVKNMFEHWYGGEFTYIESEGARLWVKVDGNRRIRLFKKNVSTVKGDIVDLSKLVQQEYN